MNTKVTKEVIRMPTQEKTTATMDSTSAQSRYRRGRGWQPVKKRWAVSTVQLVNERYI